MPEEVQRLRLVVRLLRGGIVGLRGEERDRERRRIIESLASTDLAMSTISDDMMSTISDDPRLYSMVAGYFPSWTQVRWTRTGGEITGGDSHSAPIADEAIYGIEMNVDQRGGLVVSARSAWDAKFCSQLAAGMDWLDRSVPKPRRHWVEV